VGDSLSSLKTEMLKRHVILNIVCAVGCAAEVMRVICKQGGVEHDLHTLFTLGRNLRNQTLGLLSYSNAFWVLICVGEQPSQIFSSLQMKMLLALFLQLYLKGFQVNK